MYGWRTLANFRWMETGEHWFVTFENNEKRQADTIRSVCCHGLLRFLTLAEINADAEIACLVVADSRCAAPAWLASENYNSSDFQCKNREQTIFLKEMNDENDQIGEEKSINCEK
ncbi:Uncharacterized protein TPS_03158 [Trichinella pseudospiralis]